MYEGAVKMMAKQKVALDCLSYHASAAIDDTEELAKAAIPTANTYSLHRYEYSFFMFAQQQEKSEKASLIQSAKKPAVLRDWYIRISIWKNYCYCFLKNVL